jgi:hypothetical protein
LIYIKGYHTPLTDAVTLKIWVSPADGGVEPVKPVKTGKISNFSFFPANGPTGNGLNSFEIYLTFAS